MAEKNIVFLTLRFTVFRLGKMSFSQFAFNRGATFKAVALMILKFVIFPISKQHVWPLRFCARFVVALLSVRTPPCIIILVYTLRVHIIRVVVFVAISPPSRTTFRLCFYLCVYNIITAYNRSGRPPSVILFSFWAVGFLFFLLFLCVCASAGEILRRRPLSGMSCAAVCNNRNNVKIRRLRVVIIYRIFYYYQSGAGHPFSRVLFLYISRRIDVDSIFTSSAHNKSTRVLLNDL